MPRDIVVIGASAGGSAPLFQIASTLPQDFPAAVLITRHVGAQESVLPELLNLKSAMQAAHALHGEAIRPGRIYVAPPDRHMIVDRDRLLLSAGPKENYARPAINPMFRSAAFAYGSRVIGVILSGTLDDGTAGMKAVKERGGVTIVQDPDDAQYPSMPSSTLAAIKVDFRLRKTEIAERLIQLTREQASIAEMALPNEGLAAEVEMDRSEGASIELMNRVGNRAPVSCPECGGALWKIHDEVLNRYRCHTGHGYSAATLMMEIDENLERALFAAVRLFHEREELARSLAASAVHRGASAEAEAQTELAEAAAERGAHLAKLAKTLRDGGQVNVATKSEHAISRR